MKTILVLSANPEGTAALDLGQEVDKIRTALEESQHQNKFRLVHRSEVQWEDWRRKIQHFQPEIVHFSGHGTGKKGLLVLDENKQIREVSADALMRMFEVFPCVKCVVLNACYSEEQASVIHRHVPCVVGMSLSIGDKAARDFAVAFYDGLGAGRGYKEAYKLGLTGMANDVEVWTPMLLLRESIDSPTVELAQINRVSGVNPFTYGTPVSADRFYGRMKAIQDIKDRIGADIPQCVNIIGLRSSGKSSILRYIKERPDKFFENTQKPIIVHIDLQNKRCHTPQGIMKVIRKEIARELMIEPWYENQDDDDEFVDRGLSKVRDSGYRLIVMIDKIERIKLHNSDFKNWSSGWDLKITNRLLTMVVATERGLDEVDSILGIDSDFSHNFHETYVGLLNNKDCERIAFDGLGFMSEEIFEYLNNVAGRWAFYIQMALSIYRQNKDVSMSREEFRFQSERSFRKLLDSLNHDEKVFLKSITKGNSQSNGKIRSQLERLGILTEEGEIFSHIFHGIIKEVDLQSPPQNKLLYYEFNQNL